MNRLTDDAGLLRRLIDALQQTDTDLNVIQRHPVQLCCKSTHHIHSRICTEKDKTCETVNNQWTEICWVRKQMQCFLKEMNLVCLRDLHLKVDVARLEFLRVP